MLGKANSAVVRLKSVGKNKHVSLALKVRLCESTHANNAVQCRVTATISHTE